MWKWMAGFSYAKLRSLERQERQSPELINIGDTFYQAVQEHLSQLERRLEEEHTKNPSSKKVVIISDELRNTKRTWESVFERREKKVVQAALSMARGGSHTPKFLTNQEKTFYHQLVAVLKEHRETTLEGNHPSTQPSQTHPTPLEQEKKQTPEEQQVTPPDAADEIPSDHANDVVLRVLMDVPSFMGSDMHNYSLKKTDVITMPKDMAEILIKRGAAEKITVTW